MGPCYSELKEEGRRDLGTMDGETGTAEEGYRDEGQSTSGVSRKGRKIGWRGLRSTVGQCRD